MKFQKLAVPIWAPCATVCALLCLIFPLTPALAQSTFGTILGTVTDDSGAVVPGAIVKATNTDENTSHTVTANGNGDYEFVNTKPGHYKVEVSATGFQAFSATGLLLVARQTLRVDVRLQISQLAMGNECGSDGRCDRDGHTDHPVQSGQPGLAESSS
jgi:hypothetical protein